jgi:hypothetical protein
MELTPVGVSAASELVTEVLELCNSARIEAGDPKIASLPLGSLKDPDFNCPIAKALLAMVLPNEHRVVFTHPWYAAAATKVWRVPFCDALLTSAAMPQAIYEFAVRFRQGSFPSLLEVS